MIAFQSLWIDRNEGSTKLFNEYFKVLRTGYAYEDAPPPEENFSMHLPATDLETWLM